MTASHGSGGAIDRRTFLAAGASVAGAALAPEAAASRALRSARGRVGSTLWDVEHVVVMMQENRSFDHILGTLGGVRGFADPHAITAPDGRSVFDQELAGVPGSHVPPYRLGLNGSSSQCVYGPAGLVNQSWDQTHLVWDGGGLDRWTSGATAPWSMGFLTRAELPFTYALADAFTVCDGFHASVLGPTDPNRLVLFTGTIDPEGHAGGPVIDNSHEGGLRWATLPERLQAAGVSWRVYHEADDFNDNALRFFDQYQHAPRSSPLYQNAMVNRGTEAFAQDAASGRLPQVSWIVAPTPEAEHPGYGSMAAGEDYVSRQLHAVMDNPALWSRTVFLVCYDEHGGFFDHIPPPTPPPGTRGEFVAGAPIGLGFRVPMIICSPFTRGANVCHATFDHTSIIRFIERRFGVLETNISAWRRQVCGDLTAALDFDRPDLTIPSLPATAPLLAAAQRDCASPVPPLPPLLGTQPSQEPGTRRVVAFPTPVARLRLVISPAAGIGHRLTTYRVSVLDAFGRPAPGAIVTLAGHRARTARDGVARLRLALRPRRVPYLVTAHASGYPIARRSLPVR